MTDTEPYVYNPSLDIIENMVQGLQGDYTSVLLFERVLREHPEDLVNYCLAQRSREICRPDVHRYPSIARIYEGLPYDRDKTVFVDEKSTLLQIALAASAYKRLREKVALIGFMQRCSDGALEPGDRTTALLELSVNQLLRVLQQNTQEASEHLSGGNRYTADGWDLSFCEPNMFDITDRGVMLNAGWVARRYDPTTYQTFVLEHPSTDEEEGEKGRNARSPDAILARVRADTRADLTDVELHPSELERLELDPPTIVDHYPVVLEGRVVLAAVPLPDTPLVTTVARDRAFAREQYVLYFQLEEPAMMRLARTDPETVRRFVERDIARRGVPDGWNAILRYWEIFVRATARQRLDVVYHLCRDPRRYNIVARFLHLRKEFDDDITDRLQGDAFYASLHAIGEGSVAGPVLRVDPDLGVDDRGMLCDRVVQPDCKAVRYFQSIDIRLERRLVVGDGGVFYVGRVIALLSVPPERLSDVADLAAQPPGTVHIDPVAHRRATQELDHIIYDGAPDYLKRSVPEGHPWVPLSAAVAVNFVVRSIGGSWYYVAVFNSEMVDLDQPFDDDEEEVTGIYRSYDLNPHGVHYPLPWEAAARKRSRDVADEPSARSVRPRLESLPSLPPPLISDRGVEEEEHRRPSIPGRVERYWQSRESEEEEGENIGVE